METSSSEQAAKHNQLPSLLSLGAKNNQLPSLPPQGANNNQLPSLQPLGAKSNQLPSLQPLGANNNQLPSLPSLREREAALSIATTMDETKKETAVEAPSEVSENKMETSSSEQEGTNNHLPSKQDDPIITVIPMEEESQREHQLEVQVTATEVSESTIHATTRGLQMEEKTQKEVRVNINDKMVVVHREITIKKTLISTWYIDIGSYDDDEPINPTCGERCVDLCCQSCTCKFSNPFKRSSQRRIEGNDLMSNVLRVGRAEGWTAFKHYAFPLLHDIVRDTLVSTELITVLVGLILSIATLGLDQNEVFNILHFILIVLSSIFAIIDGFSILKDCNSCKLCFMCCFGKRKNQVSPELGVEDTNKETKEHTSEDEEHTERCLNKCCSCYKNASNTVDVVRVFLTEALAYPVLICDIFEVIVGRGYEGNTHGDRLGFALFLISCIFIILNVYVIRIVIVVGMIIRVHNARRERFWDSPYARSALWYQIYFLVHTVLQMLFQVLMFIAIGGKIRYDNRHFYEDGNTDESIHVSGHLWYMIVIGYVLPTMGLCSFFLVTYHWTQEFPIGLFLDRIGIERKISDDKTVSYPGKDEETAKLKKVELKSKIAKLSEEFSDLRDTSWFKKFTYPFLSPVQICLCVGYVGILLAFVICSAVAINDTGTLIGQVLNGGGWGGYYIFFLIIMVIANAYVFAVGGLWIAIVIAVIVAIAIVIVLVLIVIIGSICNAVDDVTDSRTTRAASSEFCC